MCELFWIGVRRPQQSFFLFFPLLKKEGSSILFYFFFPFPLMVWLNFLYRKCLLMLLAFGSVFYFFSWGPDSHLYNFRCGGFLDKGNIQSE